MRFKFTHRAEPYERFAPTAFDRRIGDSWPIRLPDGRRIPAKLIAAKVAPDGQSVQFTIEAEGQVPGLASSVEGFSIVEGGE